MGILQAFKRVLSARDETVKPTWAEYVDALVVDTEAVRARWQTVTTAREIAKRIHGPALGCALINARMCAGVPIRLYRLASPGEKWSCRPLDRRRKSYLTDFARVGRKASQYAQGDGELVEVTDHPVLDLLHRPNFEQAGTEFEVERWLHKWLFGNSVALLIAGGDGVSSMVNLMPQYVRVQPDTERLIALYWFGRNEAEAAPFDADDVMHLKLSPHWNNPYWGMGPLDVVFRELDLYEFSLAAEQARWRNGGYPGGVLALKGVTRKEQIEEVTRELRRRISGADKSGNVLVTTEGTYTQLGKTNEMGYLPGMEHIERRVEQEFGVSESIRRLNDANLASSRSGADAYMRFTIGPSLAIDAEQLTEFLLPRFGIAPGSAWFAYDDVIPEDIEAIRQDAAVYVAGGVLTVDELRARLGYEPLPDGSGAIARVNGVPLDRVGQQPAIGQSQPPLLIYSSRDGEAKTLRLKATDAGLTAALLDDPGDADTVAELRSSTESWLERVLDEMRIGPDGSVNLRGHESELERVILPRLRELVSRGFAIAGDELAAIGLTAADLGEQRLADIVGRRGSLIIEQIRGTTEERIRDTLRVGVEEGRPLNEVIGTLRQDLGEQASARAETIARTEMSNAVNEARMVRWKESGIGRVRWRLAPGACEVCEALVARSGGEVRIGEAFARAGTLLAKFTTPMDILHPPAHPNCRCVLEPVFEGGDT